MKKIIQYITIMMLISNVCWGQQFVNGNFETTATLENCGDYVPDWARSNNIQHTKYDWVSGFNGTNAFIDLSGCAAVNHAWIEQTITVTQDCDYQISFILRPSNQGNHTAGVRISYSGSSSSTLNNGNLFLANTLGVWTPVTTPVFHLTSGTYTFRFTGENGANSRVPDVMGIDDINLIRVNNCQVPCACPPLPNVSYFLGPGFTRGDRVDCSTNKVINIKCQQQVNIFAKANCQGDGCTQSGVNISVAGPGVNYSTAEDENALAFFAMQKGDYVVTTTSTCNGKTCAPCKVTFRVEQCNCPPPPCCKTPMQVSLRKEEIKFQYAAETRVTIPFQLNGGGKKFTQVRANVVGFDIYSDNQKCIDCFNDSKLWGSIYNGTLNGFTPSYTGKNIGSNVNTREVVFANPVAQSINTTNLELKLFLPPAQTMTCCNVYADIFIKINYRDIECNECDTIIPVRVSLVKTKSGKPIDINLPGNPPPGVAKAKAWYVNCCPEPHPWKSWR